MGRQQHDRHDREAPLGLDAAEQVDREVGAEAVLAYMGFVQDNAEAAVKRLLGRLHDGGFTLPLDDGSRIRVSIEIDSAIYTNA